MTDEKATSLAEEGYTRGALGFAGGVAFFAVVLATKLAFLKLAARK